MKKYRMLVLIREAEDASSTALLLSFRTIREACVIAHELRELNATDMTISVKVYELWLKKRR